MTAGTIFLGRAVAFFGAERRLGSLTADDVLAWLDHLRTLKVRGKLLSEGSLRHHLNALSGLFRRAQRRRYVPQGFNPVALLERDERPCVARARTPWLEVPEAARLLWAARTYPAKPHETEMRLAHPILATFLLTGGRAKEVLGLALGDVSFEAETIAFRPHSWHRGGWLKTEGSERVVPLWPQLGEILEAYLDGYRLDRPGELLFPSPHLRADRPITDLRDMLDRVAVRAGFLTPVLDERAGQQARGANGRLLWTGPRIRTRPFRVSYTAARLQTLDRGAPVSLEVIAGELGHASREMVERVYKRIGKVRHRSEVVEFRWEQWFDERGGELREKENAHLAPLSRTRRATTS